jgi:uncharacterized phage infection (PIP) family protein YhgE
MILGSPANECHDNDGGGGWQHSLVFPLNQSTNQSTQHNTTQHNQSVNQHNQSINTINQSINTINQSHNQQNQSVNQQNQSINQQNQSINQSINTINTINQSIQHSCVFRGDRSRVAGVFCFVCFDTQRTEYVGTAGVIDRIG